MKKLCYPLLFFFLISLQISGQTQNKFAEEKPCYDSNFVNQITGLIINNLDSIKAEYYKIDAFENYPFQTASLFILSGVMLNQQQFENNAGVQNDLYNSSRIAVAYKTKSQKIGKYNFCLYGSYTDSLNFITINKIQLENIFQISVSDHLIIEKEKLLDELIKYSRENDFYLTENKTAGFNELGLMQREIMSIPILTKKDYCSLHNIASIITEDLAKLLKGKNNRFPSAANKFLIAYKKLADDVTNNLIKFGYIKIPAPRNFNYVVLE